MFKRIISSLLLLVSFSATAKEMTIQVAAGASSFQIILPANPTTGFSWQLKKYDTSLLKLTSSQFISAKQKLMGAGGHMNYTFQILKTTSKPTSLEFYYARPWEKGKGSKQMVKVIFKP